MLKSERDKDGQERKQQGKENHGGNAEDKSEIWDRKSQIIVVYKIPLSGDNGDA